jgi:hypothetical protein
LTLQGPVEDLDVVAVPRRSGANERRRRRRRRRRPWCVGWRERGWGGRGLEDLRQSRLHAIALGRVGDWREVQRVSWRPRGRGSRTRWDTNTRPRGGWPRGEQRAETLDDAVQRRRCTRGCGVEKAICRRRDRGGSAGGRPTSRRAVEVRPVNLGRTETRGPQHHRQSHARQSHARGLWEPPWTPGTPTTHVDTMFRRLRALASRSPGRIVDCEVVVARPGYFRVKNVSRGRTKRTPVRTSRGFRGW